MKKKNNTFVKVMASLALGAIILSVIGTWIVFLYEIYFNPTPQVSDLSPEELEALLEQLQLQENTQSEISWDGESSQTSESTLQEDLWDSETQE